MFTTILRHLGEKVLSAANKQIGVSTFFQRENPAVYGVNESLRDSFASRRNSVPADSSEIFDFRDTRNLRFLGTGVNRVLSEPQTTGDYRGGAPLT
jgi:hypothetical protein